MSKLNAGRHRPEADRRGASPGGGSLGVRRARAARRGGGYHPIHRLVRVGRYLPAPSLWQASGPARSHASLDPPLRGYSGRSEARMVGRIEGEVLDVNYFCRSTTIILAGRAQVGGRMVQRPLPHVGHCLRIDLKKGWTSDKENLVNCVLCKNEETRRAGITVSLDRAGATVVIRNVPAEVCENCGEEYLDEATTAQLLRTADAAARAGVQVEVRDYLAA